MKLSKLLVVIPVIILGAVFSFGQTSVDLGNGFKPYGSYEGSSLDSVGLSDGQFMLHAPLVPKYPQRGGKLDPGLLLYVSSRSWASSCLVHSNGYVGSCFWTTQGTGVAVDMTTQVAVERIVERESDPQFGVTYTVFPPRTMTTWDGAAHGLADISGNQTVFQTNDTTGDVVTQGNTDA